MTIQLRVDRHRCIGAGTCITIAPTAFDWYKGEFAKAGVIDPSTVDDERLREAALACPTGAISISEVEELLPWQLRGKGGPRRVEKTFMFTDIEGSTNLVEALGDEAWEGVLRWHNETLRGLFAEFKGEEVVSTGDGFFIGFDSPDEALGARSRSSVGSPSIGAQPGSHPGRDRCSCLRRHAGRGRTSRARASTSRPDCRARGRRRTLASRTTAVDGRSRPGTRSVTLRGTSDPIEIVTVDWG